MNRVKGFVANFRLITENEMSDDVLGAGLALAVVTAMELGYSKEDIQDAIAFMWEGVCKDFLSKI